MKQQHKKEHSASKRPDKHKLVAIYGIHAVHAKIIHKPEQITKLFIYKQAKLNKKIEKIIAYAHKLNIEISYTTDEAVFDDAKVHQGIIASCKPAQLANLSHLDEILIRSRNNPDKKLFFLILDEVTDPHNLGACLRTAAAAQVDAIIVPHHHSAGLTESVSKVACGGDNLVPVIGVNNLMRTIKMLQKAGVWIIGTAMDAPQSIYQLDLGMHLAWVLGSEHKGMRPLTAKLCDFQAHIPISKQMNSLNISVAAGVCMFETIRQRL